MARERPGRASGAAEKHRSTGSLGRIGAKKRCGIWQESPCPDRLAESPDSHRGFKVRPLAGGHPRSDDIGPGKPIGCFRLWASSQLATRLRHARDAALILTSNRHPARGSRRVSNWLDVQSRRTGRGSLAARLSNDQAIDRTCPAKKKAAAGVSTSSRPMSSPDTPDDCNYYRWINNT